MNSSDQKSKQRRNNERGSVLAVSTIGMLAFLLATGMAIDISHLYSAKTELQNAADSAAMAAAAQLNSTTGGIRQAVTQATTVMNKFDFKNDVTITPANVTFATNLNGSYIDKASAEANPQTIRFVKVTVPPKQIKVTFAALVIPQTQNLSASAVAGMSVGLTMNKFHTAITFIEPNATPLAKNQVHTLVAKAWDNTTPTSYRVLAGSGGDAVLDGTIHAYGYADSNYNLAQLSEVDECKRTKLGMNTRFADYSLHPGSNATTAPPDKIIQENITYQQYRQMQGDNVVQRADGVEDRRIMTLPIAKQSSYSVANKRVTGDRLGAFFIRRKVGTDCKLEVEYIGERLVVPLGTYSPGGIQSNELSVTVLYK